MHKKTYFLCWPPTTGNVMKKERITSFELIKVFAIVCICFCHSIPAERIEYHVATSDSWLFLIMLFRQLGSVGNALFMVASTWFLIDSDKVNVGKVKQMVADNQFISLICLVAICVAGYQLPYKTIIKQVFPFFFGTLWYITCYVLYYCAHGFVNRSLRGFAVNPLLPLFLILCLDCVFFIVGGFYFTEFVGFIMIHVFTWYLKEWFADKSDCLKKNWGKGLLFVGLLCWIFGAVFFNIVGLKFDFLGDKFYCWNRFYNPFILAMAYGLMILAEVYRKKFQSNMVNMLSGLSLFIYMFTGNQLLRVYADNSLYDYVVEIFGSSMFVCALFVIFFSVSKIIMGVGISFLYKKSLGRLTQTVSRKECDYISRRIENLLEKKRKDEGKV